MDNIKFPILFLIIFFAINSLYSQDVIIKENGDSLKVNIQSVKPETISYFLNGFDNQTTFTIDKNRISKVIYRNGVVENFISESAGLGKKKVVGFKKNNVSIDAFALGTGGLRISYERLLSESLGLKIPLSYNYYETNFNNYDLRYFSGLEINFYPTGQGLVRYFVGPAIHFGVANTDDYQIIYHDNQGFPYEEYEYEEKEVLFSRFLINNGLIITPIEAFSISITTGLGIRMLDVTENSNRDKLAPNMNFSINISLRF